MLALEAAMALLVGLYYFSPPGAAFLSRFATWQQSGGVLSAALATSLAGGLLSEVCLVYFRQGGRWTPASVANAGFKMTLFFVSGAIVFEFYRLQAVWFGSAATWPIVLRKVFADQCGYTVLWSTPYQTILTRWHTLGYSGRRLWRELDGEFITRRMLPVLVTNWLFWFPGVSLIYSMPSLLQTPLFIFATAIWGILLAAVGGQTDEESTGTLQDIVLPEADIQS